MRLQLRRVLVEVHALGRGVDDEDAARPQGVEDRRHLLGQLAAAGRRARTPMIVPHVAEDHGRLVARELVGDDDLVPDAAALEGLDARPQRQFEGVVRGGVGFGRAQQQQSDRRQERQAGGRRCKDSHERGSLEEKPVRLVRRSGFIVPRRGRDASGGSPGSAQTFARPAFPQRTPPAPGGAGKERDAEIYRRNTSCCENGYSRPSPALP